MPDGGPDGEIPPPVARGTVMRGSEMPPLVTVSSRDGCTALPYGTAERMPATIYSTVAGPP